MRWLKNEKNQRKKNRMNFDRCKIESFRKEERKNTLENFHLEKKKMTFTCNEALREKKKKKKQRETLLDSRQRVFFFMCIATIY